MEWGDIEGEIPVHEIWMRPSKIQSILGHVKPREKQGGPPSKAKYYLMTDSEPVP